MTHSPLITSPVHLWDSEERFMFRQNAIFNAQLSSPSQEVGCGPIIISSPISPARWQSLSFLGDNTPLLAGTRLQPFPSTSMWILGWKSISLAYLLSTVWSPKWGTQYLFRTFSFFQLPAFTHDLVFVSCGFQTICSSPVYLVFNCNMMWGISFLSYLFGLLNVSFM